jgi:hypothetical protein
MKERINISVILKSEQATEHTIRNWIYSLLLFKPQHMIAKKLTNGKFRSANIQKLSENLGEELNTTRASIMIKDNENSISIHKGSIHKDATSCSCSLEKEIYENNKQEISAILDEYIKCGAIVAYIHSLEDSVWQNQENIGHYNLMKKSLDGVALKDVNGKQVVDIEQNPGHHHRPNGIWFGANWRMWFGNEYYQYIAKDVLETLKNCYENIEIGNGCRRITLYESPWDYEKPEHRERQLSFRYAVGMDLVAHRLMEEGKKVIQTDAEMEIFTGEFEHGGVRLIKHYRDPEGKLILRSLASEVEIVELGKHGEVLWKSVEKQ